MKTKTWLSIFLVWVMFSTNAYTRVVDRGNYTPVNTTTASPGQQSRVLLTPGLGLGLVAGIIYTATNQNHNDNRIDVVSSDGWGSNLSHNEGEKPTGFAIKSDPADLYSGSGWYNGSGDNVIVVMAKQISKNGGCFLPVNMRCHQGNDGRWGGYTEYYSLSNDCTWLCADGYTGVGCGERSDSSTKVDYSMLKDSERSKLKFDKSKNIIEDISGFDSYDWKHAGDTRHGDIILGVVEYGTHGVKAAPVRVECIGTRVNIWHGFHGKFTDFLIPEGSLPARLLCPAGYQPNAAGTDCMEVVGTGVNSSNNNVPTIDMVGPDGSIYTYSGETLVSMVNKIKEQPNYKTGDHSVYNKTRNDKEPLFGVFCVDRNKGIESLDSLNCIDCGANSKEGVCLTYNKQRDKFGMCVKCNTGEYFNPNTCACDAAKSYSMTDLAFGLGKPMVSGATDVCWTKLDSTEYKTCVTGQK